MSLLDGLVAYWECNEGGGSSLLDATGNGHTIALTGTYSWGNGNQNGTADSIQFANGIGTSNLSSAIQDFTATCWFKGDGLVHSGSGRIIDKKYDVGFWVGPSTLTNANSWGGGIEENPGPTGNYGSFVTLSGSTWNHLAIRRAGTTKSILGNGGAVRSSETISSAATSVDPLSIGRDITSGATSPFYGNIAGVGIWLRPLSDAEIAQLYNNGQGLPYPFGIRRMGRPLGNRIIVP
jgi:hypothetical protein